MNGVIEKKLLISAVIGAGIGTILAFLSIRRNRPSFKAVLKPYHGEHKDNIEIEKFENRFDEIVEKAIGAIEEKTGLSAPPVTVTVELDDSFESDTYIEPSAMIKCPGRPYTKEDGNCLSYGIRMGSKPLADGYRGRTTVDKAMTHELTHIFMMYHIPDHRSIPNWLKEGLPIHVANQEEEIKETQKDGRKGHYKYTNGQIPVYTYGKIVDEFNQNANLA